MSKKKQGNYCFACDRNRANEKFTGKGHREHLCKDCKREGKHATLISTAEYDRKVNRLSKAIKNCLILYTDETNFFLFEYGGHRYLTTDDLESDILIYQANSGQKFIKADSLHIDDEIVKEVLYKKYYDAMDSELFLDYDDVIEIEFIEISKKRRKHIEVILSMHDLKI